MILALDVSTSQTGCTVLDDSGERVYCEAWDFRNDRHFPNLLSKAGSVKSRMLKLKERFNITHVFIETSLSAFRPGKSSAQVLLTLARFNGIVSYICYDLFGVEPEFIPATTARKLCRIKMPQGEEPKPLVLAHVLDTEKDFVVEYTVHGNPKPGTYDKADSIVIARAGQVILGTRQA